MSTTGLEKGSDSIKLTVFKMGGIPGLVVMGGDSCSEVRGFKSQHHILDGHFFTLICFKNCNVCMKRR